MEYNGAADVYFWNGVLCGLYANSAAECDEWLPEFHMVNPTVTACLEAFKWGFCFGMVITDEEYVDLTIHKESAKVVMIEEEIVNSLNPDVIGNC